MDNQAKIIKEIKEYPKFNGVFNEELFTRDFVNLKKYPTKTVLIKDIFPLINDAYPSKFNLSISEYLWSEMCKKRKLVIKKGVFDYTALPKHSFWTITRNIRDEDFDKIIEGSNQHLLIFHIIGVGGFSIALLSLENRKFYLSNFINFISKYVELSKLKIAYFPGGKINKHSIKKIFPEDINKSIYKELSKKNNFNIFPTKEETFLSLKVFGSPIFWGYRNEFFLKHNDSLIDIGTIECLPFTPKYNLEANEINYSDVIEQKRGFIGSGIGLERIMMVTEKVDNIWDISTIKPLIVFLRKKSKKDVSNRILFLLSETLKVLQYIISETKGLTTGKLGNKHRRGIVSKYLTALIGCIVRTDIEISKSFLAEFSELNKKLNPVDEKLLCESQKTVLILADIILEQLRLYKTSEKYRNRVTFLINNLVL